MKYTHWREHLHFCSLDELKVDDLYVRFKKLQKTLELLELLAEYIKDEQHDLKK